MDWEKLKTFYTVSKVGSFSLAAEEMNLNQSSVSRKILSLEDQLETKLFIRHVKGLKLTRQGEILFQTAQNMLQEAENAETLIRNEKKAPEGVLKVSVISGFASHYFAPLIPEFCQHYPKLHISIKVIDFISDFILTDVDCLIYPKLLPSDTLIQEKLMTVHMRLFASQKYLEEYGTPKKIKDLDHHKLIAYGIHKNHPFPSSNWHLILGKKKGEVRESYLDVNTTTERFYFASQGMGIVSLPMEHPELKNSDLVPILPAVHGPHIDSYLIYKKSSADIKKIILLKEYLIKAFKFAK